MVLTICVAALAPWAFHIGGQWTPGAWWGIGMLRTQGAFEYPLYVFLYPYFGTASRLRLNGVRSTSGLEGSGWLCSAQGVTQRLDLTGDIYGAYLSTEGKQISFRLLDARLPLQINYRHRRYFDLEGVWRGPQLVMHDDGGWERGFHPDPHDPKERATVTFSSGSFSDFKKLCSETPIPEKARIAPPSK